METQEVIERRPLTGGASTGYRETSTGRDSTGYREVHRLVDSTVYRETSIDWWRLNSLQRDVHRLVETQEVIERLP